MKSKTMGMAYSAKELTVYLQYLYMTMGMVYSAKELTVYYQVPLYQRELNTKDPVNITSGVKRSFCSDHAYCTMTCNSFNELVTDNQNAPDSDDDVDSEDDDIDNGVKSVLDAVKGVNLTPSSKYDSQSVLKSLTIDELPKINIFLEILRDEITVPLGDISPEFFIPNKAEKSKLRDVKKVLIGRMIVDKKDFDWLEKKLPTHIPHRYSEYMSKKQEVFSLPIIFKNESKNEDCLDIMDAYERQLTEIFTLAHGNTDMLQKHGAVLGGDQLTRERLQNVKNIRFLALTPKGRFEHLNPIVIEHWHVKQDLLSKAYKALYRAESICIPGTLFHAKTILRRQDVTGNVKSNYKAHEDLFLLMVKALLHFASDQIQVQDNEDRDSILSQLYSKVHGEEHDAEDQVMNYFINIIEWGLLIMNMNDTAKEGDFERLEINCKESNGFLLGHSIFSNFGEIVNFLLLTRHLLSPDMSLRALEGAFINTKGGSGKNKEADLVQEHCIRNKKDLIRSLGANKTEKAVMRACSAADTCVGVGRTVDGCLGLPKLSVNHTKKSSVKDLEILAKCLKTVYHTQR